MGGIKGVRYCKVVSVSDDTDCDLIKVKLSPEDDGSNSDGEYAFPLLPKMLHVKPKVGEGVFVFLTVIQSCHNKHDRQYSVNSQNPLYNSFIFVYDTGVIFPCKS